MSSVPYGAATVAPLFTMKPQDSVALCRKRIAECEGRKGIGVGMAEVEWLLEERQIMAEQKRKWRFVWRDGSVNEGYGATVEEAFAALGFGAGAVPALDYYKEITERGDKS